MGTGRPITVCQVTLADDAVKRSHLSANVLRNEVRSSGLVARGVHTRHQGSSWTVSVGDNAGGRVLQSAHLQTIHVT